MIAAKQPPKFGQEPPNNPLKSSAVAGLLKKAVLKHKLFLIIMALGTGQFLAFLLALPYRLFPSDDLAYYQHILADGDELFGLFTHPTTYRYVHPIYTYYLLLCRQIWSTFTDVSPSVLIFANLLANMVSLTMIVLTCRRVTGSVTWATGAGVIFATSAWTTNYYFFFFYAPFPVALILTGFTLLIYGSYCEKPTPRPVIFMTSGLLLALAFWSSPSAAVSVALILAVSPFVCGIQGRGRRHTLLACTWLVVGFIMVFLPYAFISGPAYLSHILDNVNSTAYPEAFKKIGYFLVSPPFSFFRVLFEYSPFEAFLVSILAIVSLFSFFRHRLNSGQGLRLCAILAALCLTHTLIVDLLPTTKLGRTHFHAYPFVIIFLAVAGHWVLNQQPADRTRKIIGRALLFFLAVNVVFSIAQILKTRTARFAVPEFLKKHAHVTNIYLLSEDPHAIFISQWLQDPRISFIDTKTMNRIFWTAAATDRQEMVIIGPTGPDSGNSILQSASLPDFVPAIPERIAERFAYLPYYAYRPHFLFEEETCLALYFAETNHFPHNSTSGIKILVR